MDVGEELSTKLRSEGSNHSWVAPDYKQGLDRCQMRDGLRTDWQGMAHAQLGAMNTFRPRPFSSYVAYFHRQEFVERIAAY